VTETLVRRQIWLDRVGDFWALTKIRQTALLVTTGASAYLLTRGLPLDPLEFVQMIMGLLLSISGCTALNMLLDRRIDAQMERTADRPLAAGRVQPGEALIFGVLLSLIGLALSFWLDLYFGLVVAAGFAVDLLVYTAWLKRRTPLSIVFGGVAGGMPVLAGRVLALGHVDIVGLFLATSILLWIPSHILTLALRYSRDYRRAGVPVWPNVYGPRSTRLAIAIASLLNTMVLAACTFLLGVQPVARVLVLGMSFAMFELSILQLVVPTDRRDWLLFKLASLYMMLSSLLLTVGSLM
jgi:protoheme IX farnesyltransferase